MAHKERLKVRTQIRLHLLFYFVFSGLALAFSIGTVWWAKEIFWPCFSECLLCLLAGAHMEPFEFHSSYLQDAAHNPSPGVVTVKEE